MRPSATAVYMHGRPIVMSHSVSSCTPSAKRSQTTSSPAKTGGLHHFADVVHPALSQAHSQFFPHVRAGYMTVSVRQALTRW